MDLGQMTVIPLPPSKSGSDIRSNNNQINGQPGSSMYYAANGTGPAAIAPTLVNGDRNGFSDMTNGSGRMTNGTSASEPQQIGSGNDGVYNGSSNTKMPKKNTSAAATPVPTPNGTSPRTMTNGGGGGGYAPLMNGSGHGSPVRTPVKSGSFYPVSKAPNPPPLKMNGAEVATTNGYAPEKFHMNEIVRTSDSDDEEEVKSKEEAEHPFFAGKRDILQTEELQEKIMSSKGTVRGVKNRVKAGIATFLEHQTGTVQKNFQACEKGQIVLYTTSMMIVRDTYDKCKMVRNILQTHMVVFEERDICMSRENQRQLAERLAIPHVDVPQVFADGQYLGGAEELEKMNENGELRKVFKKFKKVQVANSCAKCGGFMWVPCSDCHGSKKSLHRNHFTAEFCALRCITCDENGLIRCDVCESDRKSK